MRRRITLAALLLVSGAGASEAQDALTLDKAIEIALKNSFDIQLARNNGQIAKNNATPGNAGMLPEIGLGVSTNNSVSNTTQVFANGQSIDREGAKAGGLNAGVELNWTLFDGFRMFTTYDKLQEFESRGEVIVKLQVQQVIADITRQYYDVVLLQEEVKVLEEAVKLSDDRIRVAKDKLELGAGSQYDLLQSQLDQNRDRSVLLQLHNRLASARIILNDLMGQNVSTAFTVADSTIPARTIVYEEARKAFLDKNHALQVAKIDTRIAMLELNETKSQRMPRLNLSSAYNFAKSSSEAGFVASNQSTGLNYGLTLTYPLFDGFNVNRQIRNANLVLENAKLVLEKLSLQMNASFELAYRNYESAKELLALENENLSVALKNMEIANEKLRLGTISALEWRDMQVKYIEAKTNVLDASYRMKLAETDILQMSGMLGFN
jgi:outer membrane protein